MSGNKRALAIFIAAALLLALAVFYFYSGKQPSGAPGGMQMPALPVTVAQPIQKEITEWDEYTGRFESTDQIEIRARVGGYLQSVHFKDGATVKKGDLLFIIDPRPFDAAYKKAQADIASAQAKVVYTEKEFKRNAALVKSGHVSEGAFEEKRQQFDQAKAELQAANATAEQARLNLEFTNVASPVTGKISNKLVSEGNLIAGGAADATLLTTIVTLDPIYFYFDVDEQNFLKYRRFGNGQMGGGNGMPVKVALMDEEQFNHLGTLDFTDNRISEETGTLRMRAIFANPNLVLVPGLFGRIQIAARPRYRAILIPDAAVATDQARKFVFVVDAAGTVAVKDIKLGPLVDNLRVVRDGLKGEEWIIVKGIQRARPGAKVQATRETAQPASAAGSPQTKPSRQKPEPVKAK